MKFSKETEAKLAALPPRERSRALKLAQSLAKAKLRKMLDQTSRSHRTPRKNTAGETLH